MEDKIEVGEYVRFNNGEIGKVIDIKENPKRVVYSKYGEIALCSRIVKHSKQLINLIEVGDFVNGMEILHIDDNELHVEWNNEFEEFTGFLENKDIKTILTKEQFEANCYKVGEEDE